jgi:hypothetical protein
MIRLLAGSRDISILNASRPALRPIQPLDKWVRGAISPGRETHHSHPPSVEVKNVWSYTSTPHTPSWRHWDDHTFTCTFTWSQTQMSAECVSTVNTRL